RAVDCLAMAGGLGLAAAPAQGLDVNAASAEQLETLHGVGPRTAQIIVQERERAGPFESLQDLSDRVRGIGRKRLDRLQAAGLVVGAGVPVLAPPGIVATPQFVPPLPSLSTP
ncbi:ComEA family DNA-binding protein, partial [Bordetella petrii]|uniref:ComEA family DNA-binding protein n=1 Tax=Bordetella petrii TaxID=94624 RepID=UPI001E4EBBDE